MLQLNAPFGAMSKFSLMRFLFSFVFVAALTGSRLLAAEPVAVSDATPTPTVPAAAAEAGKDVVHQLNSAFTKVFEIVAPSVVIIEVTKKNDSIDNPTLDELFFQNQPDENSRRSPRNPQP